jgi:hyperosmotically inducible periplasmic protein
MGALLRAVLVLAVIVVAGFFLLGYWTGGGSGNRDVVGTGGVIDTDRARERGAELGERAASATAQVREAAGEVSLTTKIKAKMALDDMVKARAIDVTTDNGIVTITGTVNSAAERARALALAKETEGVVRVVDNLKVQ